MTSRLLLALGLAGGLLGSPSTPPQALRLATTTSTESSGLLDHILPEFEKQTGIRVHVIAVGSGKAIKLGENGDVDVVLSHAPKLEEKFVSDGWGVHRRDVMFNDFVIVGPASDPAHIRTLKTAGRALARIAATGAEFVSRGDESGTHQKEKQLWQIARVEPAGSWYLSAGLGMGKVLLMAGEKGAYTLTDRGTFLAYRARTDLEIVLESDPPLHNPYTVIAINPQRYASANHEAAMQLIEWLTAADTQAMIASYQVKGQTLFFPNAASRAKLESQR